MYSSNWVSSGGIEEISQQVSAGLFIVVTVETSGHKGMFLVSRNTYGGFGVEQDLGWSSTPSKSDVLLYDTINFLLEKTNLTSIDLLYHRKHPGYSLQTQEAT